ncbi:MAG: AI-2E family transporter [Thermaerobacter sp.]|nr:AI-2E family transporter [Thermaerobacter sp.]
MAEMKPVNWRERLTIARDVVMVVLGLGVGIYAAWAVLSRIGPVVLVLVMAMVFEITLSPLVDRLALHWRRPWAVLMVVFGAIVTIIVGGGFLTTVLASQIASLVGKLPADVHRVIVATPGFMNWVGQLGIKVDVTQIQDRVLSSIGQVSTFIVTRTLNVVATLVNGLVDTVITGFITIYLLLDAERIQLAMLRLMPESKRDLLLAVEHTLVRVIGGYVRGQVALSIMIGGAFGIGCWIIGLPYPMVLGLLAGVMELVPLLGPVLGAIVPFLLALFLHPLVQVPELLILLAAIHILESQVLVPRIMRSQVGLHPVLAVLALMIGAKLQGVWGALFAVPVAGMVVAAWVAGVRVWQERVVLPGETPDPVVSGYSREHRFNE